MIRFSKFLIEVFNKPLPYKETSAGEFVSTYQFDLPNSNGDFISLGIVKNAGKLSPASDRYYVVFSLENEKNIDRTTFKMTNDNKHQVVIMSTVVDIIRSHFKRNPIKQYDYIEFDSKINDRGRTLVYRRLATGLAKEIGGKFIEMNNYGNIAFIVKKL